MTARIDLTLFNSIERFYNEEISQTNKVAIESFALVTQIESIIFPSIGGVGETLAFGFHQKQTQRT